MDSVDRRPSPASIREFGALMIVRFATFNCGSLLARGEDNSTLTLGPERYEAKCRCVAETMERIGADVATLQEVVERDSIERVIEACGSRMRIVAATSPASRSIRTWLLSRFPVSDLHVHDDELGLLEWKGERIPHGPSIIDAAIDFGDKAPVRVFVSHLKSKRSVDPVFGDDFAPKTLAEWASGTLFSTAKRMTQAVRIRRLVDDAFSRDSDARILLMGDLNDTLGSTTLDALVGDHEAARRISLRKQELIPVSSALSRDRRFSHIYRGRRLLLDHILVSRRLWRGFVRAEIHNEGLEDRSGSIEAILGESDHAPVVADFRL